MSSISQRKTRRLKNNIAESQHYSIKANLTHSGKQVIATVCRPMPNGLGKIERKAKGHTWSKKVKVVTTQKGQQKKILMHESWGKPLIESIRVSSKLRDFVNKNM